MTVNFDTSFLAGLSFFFFNCTLTLDVALLHTVKNLYNQNTKVKIGYLFFAVSGFCWIQFAVSRLQLFCSQASPVSSDRCTSEAIHWPGAQEKLHWNPTHQPCLEGISSPSPRAFRFADRRGTNIHLRNNGKYCRHPNGVSLNLQWK